MINTSMKLPRKFLNILLERAGYEGQSLDVEGSLNPLAVLSQYKQSS